MFNKHFMGRGGIIAIVSLVIVGILIISLSSYLLMSEMNQDFKMSIETTYKIDENIKLNDTFNISFTFYPHYNLSSDDHPKYRCEISLPDTYGDGLTWVSEKPYWEGSVHKDTKIELSGVIKAETAGNWVIVGGVYLVSSDDYDLKFDLLKSGHISVDFENSKNVSMRSGGKNIYLSIDQDETVLSNEPFLPWRCSSAG